MAAAIRMSEFDVIVDLQVSVTERLSRMSESIRAVFRLRTSAALHAHEVVLPKKPDASGIGAAADISRRAKWQGPLFAEIRRQTSNLMSDRSNPE